VEVQPDILELEEPEETHPHKRELLDLEEVAEVAEGRLHSVLVEAEEE
jgi:hypothetical protein